MTEEKNEDMLDELTIKYKSKMSKKEKEEEMRDVLMCHYGLI